MNDKSRLFKIFPRTAHRNEAFIGNCSVPKQEETEGIDEASLLMTASLAAASIVS
jgi:hypothetical protein